MYHIFYDVGFTFIVFWGDFLYEKKKRRQQITQGQTFYVRGTKDTVFMSVSEMNKKSRERERRRF